MFIPGRVFPQTLRISAFLCVSAVIIVYQLFTAETQRNAEIRREELQLHSGEDL